MSVQTQDANQFRLAGDYKLPYDNEEAQRLDFQHELFRLTFKGRLYFTPFNPDCILDIGSGTSSWPTEIAKEFPESQVQGLDLALLDAFTSEPPLNYKFVQANFEHPWPVTGPFDYVHQRFLLVAMKNHKFVIDQAFQHLKPGGGGYEIQELQIPFHPLSGLTGEWSQKEYEATKALGADMMAATKWEGWMKDVGFVNIHREKFNWRLGKSEAMSGHDADVADMAFKNLRRAVDGVSVMNFVDGLGWTKEEALAYNERVKQDLGANMGTNVMPIHVIWAQKPEK